MPEFAAGRAVSIMPEMADLIAPRPFQVERGHKDGVAPDEWVGYEYAKVKRLYDTLGACPTASTSPTSTRAALDRRNGDVRLPVGNWPRGERP